VQYVSRARLRRIDGRGCVVYTLTMWKIAVSVLLLACGAALAADDDDLVVPPVTYPALVRHAPSVEGFLPWEWRIEFKVAGDLNGDGRDDVALVLRGMDDRNVIDARKRGGPEEFDTNPRMLMVAFANAAGGYDLALENHTLITRTTEPSGQDPLDPNGVQQGGIDIKNGTLQVTLGYFAGNMGHFTYTFRFEKNAFKLIGYDSVDVERFKGIMSQVSINFVTRRMKRSAGSISDDKDKSTWTTLPQKPLLTMQQVGDGMDFKAVPR
jgi:hypothetical protein